MTQPSRDDDHRDWVEGQFDSAFTIEGTIVEARLDPVLTGLANDLFDDAHPMTGFAVSGLVLDRCRRTLTERYGDEQFGIAAASVLKDVFEKVGRDTVLQTIRKVAEGDRSEAGILGEAFDLTTRNAFRRGRRHGFKLGVAAGLLVAFVTIVAANLLLS